VGTLLGLVPKGVRLCYRPEVFGQQLLHGKDPLPIGKTERDLSSLVISLNGLRGLAEVVMKKIQDFGHPRSL